MSAQARVPPWSDGPSPDRCVTRLSRPARYPKGRACGEYGSWSSTWTRTHRRSGLSRSRKVTGGCPYRSASPPSRTAVKAQRRLRARQRRTASCGWRGAGGPGPGCRRPSAPRRGQGRLRIREPSPVMSSLLTVPTTVLEIPNAGGAETVVTTCGTEGVSVYWFASITPAWQPCCCRSHAATGHCSPSAECPRGVYCA